MAAPEAGALLDAPEPHPPLTGLAARSPYFLYRGAATVARALPAPAVDVLAPLGGRVCARVMRGRRAMVERHLRRVYGPQASEAHLRREVARVFVSYARYWTESFRLPGTSPAQLDARLSYEGVAHLEEALGRGRGVIMAMPHLGGWDFGGAWFASVGGYPITVVVEPVEPPELFRWFTELRRSLGLEIVPLGADAASLVLRRLREGGVVGLVCDRDLLRTGVEVKFFGERTTLPSGPAPLALRTGAAILPTAVYFNGRRGHHGVVRPAVSVERTGSFREDAARVTQLLAGELEGLIRRAPHQWHLLQPNWPSDYQAARAP